MLIRLKSFFRNMIKKKKVEPEYYDYDTYTHKAELQLVFKDNNIICTDVSFTTDIKGEDPIKEYINRSYQQRVMHIFDKSNKYNVALVSDDIKKILYKPTITIETKQRRVK